MDDWYCDHHGHIHPYYNKHHLQSNDFTNLYLLLVNGFGRYDICKEEHYVCQENEAVFIEILQDIVAMVSMRIYIYYIA